MERYKAALLDVDGTLLDSNDAHARAFVDAMRENGFSVKYAAVRRLIGMGSDKLLPAAIGVDAESRMGKRIGERKSEIFKQMLPGLKPTPGARQFVEKLCDWGLSRVVASSAGEDEIKLLLKQAGLEDLIEDKNTADDAEESKPEPDIVLAALHKAKVHVKQAIMIGDTPYDVEAATRAGVDIIALRCGAWSDQDLTGAIEIHDHPMALVRSWDSSVLTKS
jgi:HAD superfamily hydrolase (TIGR01549 family)